MSEPASKIRALIVDDEPIARRGIRGLLKTAPDLEIIGECSNGHEAVAMIEKQKTDLVFLDVQMPILSGFDVIEKIGAEKMPLVVFVTAFDHHAIAAFETGALDYLLKPIDAERFQKTLNRVREQFRNSQNNLINEKLSNLLKNLEAFKERQPEYAKRLVIKEQGRVFFLNVEEIDWIAAQGNYVEIHAGKAKHLLRETMDGIEQKLNPAEFLRLRRSTIVRIEKIRELQPLFGGEFAVILKNGTELTSSRRYRKNLETILKP